MQPQFLILGAGITGAALAHRLVRSGARVTIVDAATPASAATGRSFGWINASFHLSEAHFHLRHAAMGAHQALAVDLGLHPAPQGCLWFEETGAQFDHRHAALARLGYPLRLLDRGDIVALEPHLAHPPDRALLFPTEQAVDLASLTESLLSVATASGARLILGNPATGLIKARGRVTGIATSQGAIGADHVILATGTGTPALLAPLGLRFPMLHRPGAIFRSRPLPPLLTHIIASPAQELRQDAQGHLLSPASAAHQSDSAETWANPAVLLADTLLRLRHLLPQADIQPDRLILAERPVPGDGLPAIGPVLPGLSMAVMHSGATLAPLVANLLTAELLGQGEDPTLAPFRPARFFA